MSYLRGAMPKSPTTKRIEVHLLPDVIEALKKLADKENRSLKNYLETLIHKHLEQQKKK
jgi:hypothetical protein